MSNLFLLGQVVLGAYFIVSGLGHFTKLDMLAGYTGSKNIPSPKLAVLVTGAMMIFGGLGVLFQYQLVWAYGLLIAFLLPASFLIHPFWKDIDPNTKMMNRVNFEKNLALAAALLMLLAF